MIRYDKIYDDVTYGGMVWSDTIYDICYDMIEYDAIRYDIWSSKDEMYTQKMHSKYHIQVPVSIKAYILIFANNNHFN